jgi:hypothetical protein
MPNRFNNKTLPQSSIQHQVVLPGMEQQQLTEQTWKNHIDGNDLLVIRSVSLQQITV